MKLKNKLAFFELLEVVSKFFERLQNLKPFTKVALVLGGHVLAFLGACGAFYVYWLGTQTLDRNNYGGMYAFGDSIYFFGVWGFLSLVPTGLALFFLRSSQKFWNLFSYFALALALTGPAAEVVNTLTFGIGPNDYHNDLTVQLLSLFGLARLGLSPLLILCFFISFFTAPSWSQKIKLMVATIIEIGLFLYVMLMMFLHNRFV